MLYILCNHECSLLRNSSINFLSYLIVSNESDLNSHMVFSEHFYQIILFYIKKCGIYYQHRFIVQWDTFNPFFLEMQYTSYFFYYISRKLSYKFGLFRRWASIASTYSPEVEPKFQLLTNGKMKNSAL